MASEQMLVRTLHPEIRIEDARRGIVRYIASDETIDSYREVIRANGWRFDLFKKNAPFVDSHNYTSIKTQLGQVIEFKVERNRLVNVVEWAVDVPENELAQLGWKMTQAGFLKAVSVGFMPVKAVSYGQSGFPGQLRELGIPEESAPSRIYTEQQQVELSAVIIGANSNALLEAKSAGLLSDRDLHLLAGRRSELLLRMDAAARASSPAPRTRAAFLSSFDALTQPERFRSRLRIL